MNMSLEYPWMLLLLILPFIIFKVSPAYMQPAASIYLPFFSRIVAATGQAPTSGNQIKQRKRIQALALLLSWIVITLCIARPVLIGKPIVTQKAGRDMMIAVDLSQSMEQKDYLLPSEEPSQGGQLKAASNVSRLVALKSLLSSFSQQRDGDRLGLIVFGSGAYLQVPFTEDVRLWQTLLEQMDTQMAGPATAIGDAVGLSIRAFERSNTSQRILLLVTDGSDTSSRLDPVDAARVAAAEGIEIFTLGMGSVDTVGDDQVDFNTLNKIAKITNGRAFEGNSSTAIAEILAQIDKIAPAKYQQNSFLPKSDLYPWLLGPMLVIYICVWLSLTIAAAVRVRRRAYAD